MLFKLRDNLSVIIFGCIWGIFELTLGGFFHLIHYPLKGQVMGAIGYAIMAAYVIKYRKIWGLLLMGCIAAGFKFFSIFIFHVPPLSMMIINPAASIIIEAATAAAVSFAISKFIEMKIIKGVVNSSKLP